MTACTQLVSGGRRIPVAPGDSKAFFTVRTRLEAPNITVTNDAHPLLLLKFAFDGTLNDRSRVPADERETIVAHIADRVPHTIYYPGVGMQSQHENLIDAAIASSMFTVANKAKGVFFNKVRPFLHDHPNGEIRVFVTGFSRGAATARQFMNLVDDTWHANHIKSVKLRFYALLYDTISTGQNDNPMLHLGLPRDLNYSLQFVSRDEPRKLYTVDIDRADDFSTNDNGYLKRINTILLPGAHSDVGASYANGIGDDYLQMTDYILALFGLIPDRCFAVRKDAMLLGKHDSRGWLDLLTNIPAPNSAMSTTRPYRYVTAAAITSSEAEDIANSNQRLWDANDYRGFEFINQKSETFGFTATNHRNSLRLVAVPKDILRRSAKISRSTDGGLDFVFSFVINPNFTNKFHFSPHVVKSIKAGGSEVSVTYLSLKNTRRFNIYVDNVIVDYQDLTQGSTIHFHTVSTCPNNI